MKPIYYHEKIETGAKRPFIVTVCLIFSQMEKMIVARGTSICSFRDNYNRKRGNLIAYGRAMKAIEKKCNGGPINEELRGMTGKKCITVNAFKKEFIPNLTDYENKLVTSITTPKS